MAETITIISMPHSLGGLLGRARDNRLRGIGLNRLGWVCMALEPHSSEGNVWRVEMQGVNVSRAAWVKSGGHLKKTDWRSMVNPEGKQQESSG